MVKKNILDELSESIKKSYRKNKKNTKTKIKKEKSKKNYFSEKSILQLLSLIKNKYDVSNIYYELIKDKKNSKASEFLTKYLESINYIYTIKNDTKTEVWIYNEGIYLPNGISELRIQLRNILGSGYSTSICDPILDKIFADTMIEQKLFMQKIHSKENAHLLPVQNGILNLKSKTLQPFSPNIIFLNKLPIKFNPKAKCPNIEKHFKEVLSTNDDSKVMFEIIGFCLFKDYFIEKAILFNGDGRNGKSKSIELIKSLLGHENCCSVPLSEFKEGDFSIGELFGKMVNLAGDLSNTALKDTGNFKMSVGRDTIGANRKFLTKIHFVNYAKNIFACNELPKVYDNSTGFWERWIVLDFPYTFVEEDEYNKIKKSDNKELIAKSKKMNPDIISTLTTTEELEGLLIKALDGLQTILQKKSFSYSKGSDEIKKLWTRKADSFLAFCQDNIESGDINNENDKILKANIRRYYHLYCKQNKLKGSSDMNIKITLEEYYGVSELRTHNQETFWSGIKIKSDSPYKKLEEAWLDKNIVKKFSF